MLEHAKAFRVFRPEFDGLFFVLVVVRAELLAPAGDGVRVGALRLQFIGEVVGVVIEVVRVAARQPFLRARFEVFSL